MRLRVVRTIEVEGNKDWVELVLRNSFVGVSTPTNHDAVYVGASFQCPSGTIRETSMAVTEIPE